MDGFLLAKNITKEYAKTFYFASLFLEKEKRNAAYTVYAICRYSDEITDNPNSHSKKEHLDKLKEEFSAVYDNSNLNDPILIALRQTVEKYSLPKEYFTELLAGMYMDLDKNRYENFNELYRYCYKVAGVVGLIILQIFGYNNQKAKDYAIDLGIAMQLTNILRDIKEDFSRGRIYLPKDEMERFAVTETDVSKGKVNDNFKALLRFQIARARQYYANSEAGEKMPRDSNSRFVVTAMSRIYSGILNSIEKNNYDVFSKRAYVNIIGKIAIVLNILLKSGYR